MSHYPHTNSKRNLSYLRENQLLRKQIQTIKDEVKREKERIKREEYEKNNQSFLSYLYLQTSHILKYIIFSIKYHVF